MGEAAIEKIIEESLKKVIEEIHCTRKELKNSTDSSETRLLMKLEENNNKIKLLQAENQELKNKVEYLYCHIWINGKYNNCYIKESHLILDGEKCTVEELTFIDGKTPNSVPPTPTLQDKFSPEQTVVPLVERNKETPKPTKFNKGTKTSKIATTNEKSDRTTRFGSTSSNR
ncbi:unnamed protein product [Psylliodes chrysocephalus]|uniref:Uncharacterized protein n=1 Tax=Psylliodes chrysocephalus TaxID=3402493 RepID=A0A9P0GFE8_9CUCU|nr:unnamed protein product [Psylliodes chrysocephala]